jgi:hypothetical protein
VKITRTLLAVAVALLAGGAVALGATNITGTPLTLACGDTYTQSLSLSDATSTTQQLQQVYTTPACPTTVTQTVTRTITVTTPTATTPTSSVPQPVGPTGTWALTFDDEFNGTALNTSTWATHDGWTNQNGVTDRASNVSESGGDLNLAVVSATSGAAVQSNTATLAVGQVAEARIDFTGSGTYVNDWPAWWTSGPNWPSSGENDIAEGLGPLTVNYHSPAGASNDLNIGGAWGGAFHDYTIERFATYCEVWWDGTLVRKYATSDNGEPEWLRLTIGYGGGTFTPTQMRVDYVRVWGAA